MLLWQLQKYLEQQYFFKKKIKDDIRHLVIKQLGHELPA